MGDIWKKMGNPFKALSFQKCDLVSLPYKPYFYGLLFVGEKEVNNGKQFRMLS